MRHWIIFVAATILGLGSFVAALATQQARDYATRGIVNPMTADNLPYRVPRLGVNANLEQYSPVERRNQLTLMKNSGIRWVRQEIIWDDPGLLDPTSTAWTPWDDVVAAVAEFEDIELILVLKGVPPALRDSRASDHSLAPPEDPAAFADFAFIVSSKYGAIVDYYQVWDEPNLMAAWGGLEPSPAGYAALLEAAYHAIQRGDGVATVLSAALAPTSEQGPNNINEWAYLEALYAYEADAYFDGVGAKPYGFDSSPDNRDIELGVLNFSRVVRLREIMENNGDGHKAIWASNWGWNGLPQNWQGPPSIWGQVSAETQVEYTLGALDRAENEWPWIAAMTLFHWQPDAGMNDPVWGFALIDQNDEPTPLYDALHSRDARKLAGVGWHAPDSQFASYQGVWTLGERGADIGWLSDSRFLFDFSGTEIGLRLREGDFVGYLYPSLSNGHFANQLPEDNRGNRYIVLTDPLLEPNLSVISIATDLPNRDHQLEVVVDRGWDQWVLSAFVVGGGDHTASYNRQIFTAWLSAGIALFAAIIGLCGVNWQPIIAPISGVVRSLSTAMHLAAATLTSGLLLIGLVLSWGPDMPSVLRRDEISLLLSIATVGLIYIEPPLVISIFAALVLFWLLYHRLDIGLILVVMWVPFFLFPVRLYLYFFPMAEVIVLLLSGAALLRGLVWLSKYYRSETLPDLNLQLTAIDIGVIAYVVIGGITLTYATYREPAITEFRTLFVEPALFYAIARFVVRDFKGILWLVRSLIVAGIVVSVIGLYMYVMRIGVITAEGDVARLAGVYGSPNNVALFLGRVVPFALAFALIIKTRFDKWLGVSCLVVGLPTVVLTQSAGAIFIGFPVALSLVLVMALRRRSIMPVIVLIVAFLIMFVILFQSPRFARLLYLSSGTNFFRLRVWESAVDVIRDFPLRGLGLDQFLYAFRGVYIRPDAWQEPDLSHPHNFILDFWVRLGLSGLLAFVFLQVLFWKRIIGLYRSVVSSSHAIKLAMVVGAAGSMTNLLSHGFVDNSVFVIDLSFIFMLLLLVPMTIRNSSA